jgi:hypothetical protein
LYEKYKDSKKSPEQKAFASLLKFVFQITNDLLKDVKDKEEESNRQNAKFKYDWNTMERELFRPFAENSDWNSHLPDHPAVQEFKSKIVAYLKDQGYDSRRVKDFENRFDLYIEKSATDPILEEFNKYSTILQQNKDLVGYLKYVETLQNYSLTLDQKPLHDYYIDHYAVFARVEDTWSLGDEQIYEKYSQDTIKNVKEVIEEELLRQPSRWYLIIGASFGIGKTSMARVIASEYATSYLDETGDPAKHKTGNYIPILIFLRDGLKVEYNQDSYDSLHNVFDSIIAPSDNKEARKREILLILDGLNEYDEKETRLIDKLDELHGKYPNIKAIITTRLEADILSSQKIKADSYARLLHFTPEQVGSFFAKYGVKVGGEQLTYWLARHQNIPVEEMKKPLFAWIFSFLEMYRPELKIESKKGWTDKMMKSWIYIYFFIIL